MMVADGWDENGLQLEKIGLMFSSFSRLSFLPCLVTWARFTEPTLPYRWSHGPI